MAVRSSALVRFKSIDAFSGVIGTVLTGETWIVKQIHLHNGAASPQTFVLTASSDSPLALAALVNESINAGQGNTHSTWFVMDPGDTLTFVCTDELASVWVSGARLIG